VPTERVLEEVELYLLEAAALEVSPVELVEVAQAKDMAAQEEDQARLMAALVVALVLLAPVVVVPLH